MTIKALVRDILDYYNWYTLINQNQSNIDKISKLIKQTNMSLIYVNDIILMLSCF